MRAMFDRLPGALPVRILIPAGHNRRNSRQAHSNRVPWAVRPGRSDRGRQSGSGRSSAKGGRRPGVCGRLRRPDRADHDRSQQDGTVHDAARRARWSLWPSCALEPIISFGSLGPDTTRDLSSTLNSTPMRLPAGMRTSVRKVSLKWLPPVISMILRTSRFIALVALGRFC